MMPISTIRRIYAIKYRATPDTGAQPDGIYQYLKYVATFNYSSCFMTNTNNDTSSNYFKIQLLIDWLLFYYFFFQQRVNLRNKLDRYVWIFEQSATGYLPYRSIFEKNYRSRLYLVVFTADIGAVSSTGLYRNPAGGRTRIGRCIKILFPRLRSRSMGPRRSHRSII